MEHPGEHRIELYVLQAPLEVSEREQIEAHLKECAGCRSLADASSSFYEALRRDILTRPPGGPVSSRSIATTSRRVPAIFQPPFRDAHLSQVHSAGAVRRFVRAHPFVAGGGGLALLGVLAVLMLTFDLMPARESNLSTVIENQSSNTLDAYNRRGEKLWTYPVPHLSAMAVEEERTGQRFVQLADLDGDGRNEIITSLPLGPNEVKYGEVLHVLDHNKIELWSARPGEAVSCRGRVYPDEFRIDGFSVGDFSGSGHMEILVAANDLHSPAIVSRFDASGNRLGTFRHFGQLNLMGTQPLAEGARKEFVLYGGSDSEEGNLNAILVGLDPSRITGDGESSFSGGFGLPHSAAERYYVRIPPTELARAHGMHVRFSGAMAVPLQAEKGFRVVAAGEPDSLHLYFEYIFRTDFSIVEVKSENETKRVFDGLATKGLASGSFFDDYMKVVAGEIRYWDGHRWQVRPTPVVN